MIGYPKPGATFSECGKYRYSLVRELDGLAGCCNFIMLNPSTADATMDDPTIRRCRDFATRMGFRRLVVTNLFAFRATDPDCLRRCDSPISPPSESDKNDLILRFVATFADLVVCAWGSHGALYRRDDAVFDLIKDAGAAPKCLGVTMGGYPRHPLYLPKATEIEDYAGRKASLPRSKPKPSSPISSAPSKVGT